jgi:precorrin-3B synthase
MSQRRGACPALFTPMQTGDGLLARIVPAERITPAAFAAFCAAAQRHGNGTIEVSARGSLQVRGLTAASAPGFADEVAALGVAALGMRVLSDPLPDDPEALIDAGAMAAELRTAIAEADLALAPKVCVILDGGGSVHLDALTADVRLRAFARDGEIRLALALAGDATTAEPLGSIPIEAAVEVVVDVLRVVATRGDVRASDVLRTEGLGAFSEVSRVRSEPALRETRAPVEIVGVHPLRHGRAALGMTLAFGHAQAETLMALANTAVAYDAHSVRPTAGRALLLIGVAEQDAIALAREAEQLGFLTRTDDPRRRIVACPGAPACASGFIAARKLASELADLLSAPQDEDLNVWRGSGTIHISGCAKGCAHPQPAALTVVGTERGCGIVEHGTARATPQAHVDPQDLKSHLSRRVSEPAHG